MTAAARKPAAGALLFDLDGTLIDSDPLHSAVFRELFAERGRNIDHDFYLARLHGRLNADLFAEHFPDEDAAALTELKEARVRARLQQAVPPTPGLVALLGLAAANALATAVVTNAPRPNALAMLRAIGMEDAFGTLVIGDECTRGKPHPEPYLEAMRRLGVAPAQCVAFEDSGSGLRSAKAAGAFCVGLRSSLDADALRRDGAGLVIVDFTDPALADLLAHRLGVRA